jgi:hypothetical protein
MKKKLMTAIVLFVTLYSSNTFAQTAPGDSGDGGIDGGQDTHPTIQLQPAPLSFKRNNGDGTCGGEGEIRVVFPYMPDYLPTIDQVRAFERDVQGIVIEGGAGSEFQQKGYISYCIKSANILPACKLWIRFHYEVTGQDFWVTESLNPVQNKGGDH